MPKSATMVGGHAQLDVYASAADAIQRKLRNDMVGRTIMASPYGSQAVRKAVQRHVEEFRKSFPYTRDLWET